MDLQQNWQETSLDLWQKLQQKPTIKLGIISENPALQEAARVMELLGCRLIYYTDASEVDDLLRYVDVAIVDSSLHGRLGQKQFLVVLGALRRLKKPWLFWASGLDIFKQRSRQLRMALLRRPFALVGSDDEIAAMVSAQNSLTNTIKAFLQPSHVTSGLQIKSDGGLDVVFQQKAGRQQTLCHMKQTMERRFAAPSVWNGSLQLLLLATLSSVTSDSVTAAIAASMLTRAAVWRADGIAAGPGSFQYALVDALANMRREYLYHIQCELQSAAQDAA